MRFAHDLQPTTQRGTDSRHPRLRRARVGRPMTCNPLFREGLIPGTRACGAHGWAALRNGEDGVRTGAARLFSHRPPPKTSAAGARAHRGAARLPRPQKALPVSLTLCDKDLTKSQSIVPGSLDKQAVICNY